MSGRGKKKGGLDEAGQRLVIEHKWLAEVLSRQFAWLSPKTVDGDITQPAYEGLTRAALSYDPKAGDFVAYARKWIIGAIFKAVDKRCPGFAEHYGDVAGLFDEIVEEGETFESSEVVNPVDHVAVVMAMGSESVRQARGQAVGLWRILEEVLSNVEPSKKAVFFGRMVEGMEWEELADKADISVRQAQRWVSEIRSKLLYRLEPPR